MFDARRLLPLAFLSCALVSSAAAHAPITIDGDPSDWIGTPSPTVHEAVVSEGEWIYTGAPNDARTDLGDDPNVLNPNDPGDGNSDLLELRVALTGENLCFLVRYRDITRPDRPSFAFAVDGNTPDDTDSITFLGDEANVFLDEYANTWDQSIQIHITSLEGPRVEIFDDTGVNDTWHAPSLEQSMINVENDVIEFVIPRADLGFAPGQEHTMSIQAATFENQMGEDNLAWNNDRDSTRPIGEGPDALDVMGGRVGEVTNAWERVFADSLALDSQDPTMRLIYNITLPSDGTDVLTGPTQVASTANANLPAALTQEEAGSEAGIVWQFDVDVALRAAARLQKPVLVSFVTARSLNARRMEAETWRNPAVIQAVTDRYIPVRIFMESDQSGAAALGVYRSPSTMLLQVQGDQPAEQARIDGFVGPDELLSQLP